MEPAKLEEEPVDTPIDFENDPMARASLTKEQRQVWDLTREELRNAREKIADLETRLKALERVTHEDGVIPSVLTRPEFNREVARMLAFDERYGGMSSVLYFDIENLEDISQECGKPVSDNIMRVFCDVLAKHVRTSDILGRLGPDEFGVFLTRCDNDHAWKKGEALASLLAEEMKKIPRCAVQPVINYGAYTFREKENAATGLQQAADTVTRSDKEQE